MGAQCAPGRLQQRSHNLVKTAGSFRPTQCSTTSGNPVHTRFGVWMVWFELKDLRATPFKEGQGGHNQRVALQAVRPKLLPQRSGCIGRPGSSTISSRPTCPCCTRTRSLHRIGETWSCNDQSVGESKGAPCFPHRHQQKCQHRRLLSSLLSLLGGSC